MVFSRRKQYLDAVISRETDECTIWPFAVRKSNGYGAFDISEKGIKINFEVHRWVCLQVHGEAPYEHEAAHKCGNKLCVNPKHIYWATRLTNMQDVKDHGTSRGGGRYRQKIFQADIEAICASKESHVTVAAKYGVEPAYIGRLRRTNKTDMKLATQKKVGIA